MSDSGSNVNEKFSLNIPSSEFRKHQNTATKECRKITSIDSTAKLNLAQKNFFEKNDRVIVAGKNEAVGCRSLREAIITQISYHSIKRLRTTVYKVQFVDNTRCHEIQVVGADQIFESSPSILQEKEQYEAKQKQLSSSGKPSGVADNTVVYKHPPYTELVIMAVFNLNDAKGSSHKAILKWIGNSEWKASINFSKFRGSVGTAIKICISKGRLIQNKGSFRLSAAETKRFNKNDGNMTAATIKKMNTPKEDTLLMELDSSTGPLDAKTTKRKERKHFPRFENHLLLHAKYVGSLLVVSEILRVFQPTSLPIQSLTIENLEYSLFAGLNSSSIQLESNSSNNDTIESELERRDASSETENARNFLSELHLGLLRLILGRNLKTGAMLRNDTVTYSSLNFLAEIRIVIGDLLNFSTWPEILRCLMIALYEYQQTLNIRFPVINEHQQLFTPPAEFDLQEIKNILDILQYTEYWSLTPAQGLTLLRWLVEQVIDVESCKKKIEDSMEVESNLVTASKEALATQRTTSQISLFPNKHELEIASETMANRTACIRRHCIGMDRFHNRYWIFFNNRAQVHIERSSSTHNTNLQQQNPLPAWSQIATQTEFSDLISSLDDRGIRERALKKYLLSNIDKLMGAVHIKESKPDRLVTPVEPRRSSRIKIIQELNIANNPSIDGGENSGKNITRETSDSDTYQPLSYPWSHCSLNKCTQIQLLVHIKSELLELESQASQIGASLGGGNSKSKLDWQQCVREASTAHLLVPAVIDLEQALFHFFHESSSTSDADYFIDWKSTGILDVKKCDVQSEVKSSSVDKKDNPKGVFNMNENTDDDDNDEDDDDNDEDDDGDVNTEKSKSDCAFENDKDEWKPGGTSHASQEIKKQLIGCLSAASDRSSWIYMVYNSRTLAQIAVAIYSLSAKAGKLIFQLQNVYQKDRKGENSWANNNKLLVKCRPLNYFEVVWVRINSFPWWPALVLRPIDDVFLEALISTGDKLVAFIGEQDIYRVNQRYCRPFFDNGTNGAISDFTQGNTDKNLLQAIQNASKALILSKEMHGENDPNALQNHDIKMPYTANTNSRRPPRDRSVYMIASNENAEPRQSYLK